MINLFQMDLPAPVGWAVSGIDVALSEARAPTPDLVYLPAERAHLIRESFAEGIPGIVVEALSTDRARDPVMKRQWHAEAGVPEYWIPDPANDSLTMLELPQGVHVTREVLCSANDLITPSNPGFVLPLHGLCDNPGRPLPIGPE